MRDVDMKDRLSFLATARTGAGMSQGELADVLGLETRASITHIEQGRRDPKLSMVLEWLAACGLKLHTQSTINCPACGGSLVSEVCGAPIFLHDCAEMRRE